MSKETLRLRMFAGPNGSGKSTFKSIIRPELLGIFINPDEIEKQIQYRKHDQIVKINSFHLFSTFFQKQPLYKTMVL